MAGGGVAMRNSGLRLRQRLGREVLLEEKERLGHNTNATVKEVAAFVDQTPRNVWRIAKALPKERTSAMTLGEVELQGWLQMAEGNLAQAYRLMDEAGVAIGVGPRQFTRIVSEQHNAHALEAARRGHILPTVLTANGASAAVRLKRNEEWATDHTYTQVWVRVSKDREAVLHATPIVDVATGRHIHGGLTHEPPNSDYLADVLAAAIIGREVDGEFVGGLPRSVRSDRGPDMLSAATIAGLLHLGVTGKRTAGYRPDQNPFAERCHRTNKDMFWRSLPGYFDPNAWPREYAAAWKERGHPFDPERLLWFEDVVALYDDFLDSEDNRPRERLGGLTPAQAWAADTTPIIKATGVNVRAMLTTRYMRKADRGKVTVPGSKAKYLIPTVEVLSDQPDGDEEPAYRRLNLINKQIEVGLYRADGPTLAVFEDGKYVGEAIREDLANEETAAAVMRQQNASRALVSAGLIRADEYRDDMVRRRSARIGWELDPNWVGARTSSTPEDSVGGTPSNSPAAASGGVVAVSSKQVEAAKAAETEAGIYAHLNQHISEKSA